MNSYGHWGFERPKRGAFSSGIAACMAVLGAGTFLNNIEVIPSVVGTAIVVVAYGMVVLVATLRIQKWPEVSRTTISLASFFLALFVWTLCLTIVVEPALSRTMATYAATMAMVVAASTLSSGDSFIRIASRLAIFALPIGTLSCLLAWDFLSNALQINANVAGLLLGLIGTAATWTTRRTSIWLSILLIAAVGVTATGSRSALLLLAVYGVVFAAWPWLTRHKAIYWMLLITVIVFGFVVPMALMQLYQSELGDVLQALSRDVTGENFFSGRERMWLRLTQEYGSQLLVGLGFVNLEIRGYETLSLHNGWLTMLAQGGIVGLTLLIALFVWMWDELWRRREGRMARIAGSLLVGFLFQQAFETAMFQNNLSYPFWVWLVLGLSLGGVQSKRHRVHYAEQSKALLRSQP